MSRVTNHDRERIAKAAINAAFQPRVTEQRQREHELGMEAYEAVIPAAERLLAAQMPDGWLRLDACLRFNAGGWSGNLTVNPAVPVPHSTNCRQLGTLTGDLAERVQAHMQQAEKLRTEKWQAEQELQGFLAGFKSFRQMRDAWPEGEPFYAALDVDRPASGVPAVRVAQINKLLNLSAAA